MRISDGSSIWERDLRDESVASVWMNDKVVITANEWLQRVHIFDRRDGTLIKQVLFRQPNPKSPMPVQFVRGEEPGERVAFYYPYMSNSGGGWMGALPEVGDFVLCAKPTFSESYHVICYKPLPRTEQLFVGWTILQNVSLHASLPP